MLPHLGGTTVSHATADLLLWTQVLLSTPAVLWLATDYYRRGWQGLRRGSLNMYTLIGLAPKVAHRPRDDGSEEEAAIESVVAGDRLRVRPGEKLPVDKGPVDKVVGATVNQTGALVVDAVRGRGQTVMYLSLEGQPVAWIEAGDPVKPEAAATLRALREEGRRATVRNIRQNLVFALGYNALCIPLAAGVLYPFTGWLLSPIVAALAMSLSSVSVIGNALRLRSASL